LYFLLPDVQSAKVVHNDLLLAKVEERHMHVLAKDDIDLQDLPEAGLTQRSDVVHGLQMGVVLGALTGMLLSSLALMLGLIVPGLEVWSVGSLTAGGAFIGAFGSSMIAVNVSNTRLQKFQPEIDRGSILFMVDVPADRVDEINGLVKGHHPEADARGTEPTIPAFP
jgi:hypothetical protein